MSRSAELLPVSGKAPSSRFRRTADCIQLGTSASSSLSGMFCALTRIKRLMACCFSRRARGSWALPSTRYSGKPTTGITMMASSQAIAEPGRRFRGTMIRLTRRSTMSTLQ